MEGAKTVLAKVDATVEQSLAERFEVKSFPTLKYFLKGGDPIEYDGPREADGIAEWLRKREKPVVEEIEAAELDSFIEKGLGSGAYVVVAHVKKKSARAKAFFKAAEALVDYKASKLRFAAVWLAKSADPKKDATMAMSRPNVSDPIDPQKLDFTASWTDGAITKWVRHSSYPMIGKDFKVEKYGVEAVQELGAKGSVVGIYGDEKAGETVGELFRKVAPKEKDWRFTALAESSVDSPDLLGLRGEVTAQITVLHGEKKYVLKEGLSEEDVTAAHIDHNQCNLCTRYALKKLLADVLAKKAQPYYKSASPTTSVEDGVLVLTGETFEQIALDSKKDVFVEFYAPWCGHCKKLAPAWTELSQKVEKLGYAKRGVVVAKMDATANECEEQITGYPMLVLYPAVKKEKKMREKKVFTGQRDFDPMMDFLVDNAVNLEGEEMAESVGKKASMVDRERAKKKKKEL